MKYKKLKFTWRDPLAVIFTAAAVTGVFLLNAYGAQLMAVIF